MNTTYKYSLDTSSKKFLCPNCNKKTFVKFIDNETKLYLNAINGRCDRESKCGYFKTPEGNTTINTNCITETPLPSYHCNTLLHEFTNNQLQNNFVSFLKQHFSKENVSHATAMFHICATNYWKGATIFWQIDHCNTIRGGKIMLYDCITGKRVKKPYNHVSWIHKQLKLNDFVLQQCLFGLHNLNCITKDDTICIVESEKTAIIMSIVVPKFLWMATGSNTGFKKEMLQPIKEYNIIAYPDKTEFTTWNKKAIQLNKYGFSIQCSSLLEYIDLENGGDLVDYLF